MEKFEIYLAGKCKDLTFDDCNNWRSEIKKELEQEYSNSKYKVSAFRYKVSVFNPNDYFNYFEKLHKTNKQIKDFYFSRLDRCDLVIVNLNNSNSSVGTGQELQRAVDKNIPIIGFGTTEMYPWEVESDCQVVFDTLEECLAYVKYYYLY